MVHYANRNKIKPKPKPKKPQAASPSNGSHAKITSDLASLNLEDPPFEIKEVPGKGLGILATRNLNPGDLVLRESPILYADDSKGVMSFYKSYLQLSDQDRQLYDSLHIAKVHLTEHAPPLAISLTNAFGIGPTANECAVFVKGSRFNHSCRPNVNHRWDEEQKCMWFICGRTVKKGEELCVCYNNVRKSRKERQKTFRESYEFDCACETCSLSEEDVVISDASRIRIQQLEDELMDFEGSPLELIKLVHQLFRIAEEERLLISSVSWAFKGLSVCIWHGDKDNAERWIERVLEFEKLEAGIWSTKYKGLLALKGRTELSVEWLKKDKMILAGPEC